MSGKLIALEDKKLRKISRLLSRIRDEERDQSPMIEHIAAIIRMCAIASAGEERVDSFRPWVRIYKWKDAFQIEVACNYFPVAEWTIYEGSRYQKTISNERIKQAVPWARIKGSTDWYGDLKLDTTYWRALEADILSSSRDAFSRFNMLERGDRIERALIREFERSEKR